MMPQSSWSPTSMCSSSGRTGDPEASRWTDPPSLVQRNATARARMLASDEERRAGGRALRCDKARGAHADQDRMHARAGHAHAHASFHEAGQAPNNESLTGSFKLLAAFLPAFLHGTEAVVIASAQGAQDELAGATTASDCQGRARSNSRRAPRGGALQGDCRRCGHCCGGAFRHSPLPRFRASVFQRPTFRRFLAFSHYVTRFTPFRRSRVAVRVRGPSSLVLHSPPRIGPAARGRLSGMLLL